MFLDDGERAAENVGEGARLAVRAGLEVDGDDEFGAEEESAFDGNKGGEEAVDESAALEFYGNEQAGISAGSAQGRAKQTAVVVDGQAEIDIGGGDGERLLQLFKGFCWRKTSEEFFEAIVGGETEPGGGPAAEVSELDFVGGEFHGFERSSGTIGRTDESADAGAGDDVDGDACFAKDAENTDVGDAAGETASERNADTRTRGAAGRAAISKGTE